MRLPWPPALQTHPQAEAIPGIDGPQDDAEFGSVFNGLRIRMAVSTGKPESIRIHPVTKRHEYSGTLALTADALLSVATGGMIIVDTNTFSAVNGR